MVGRVSTGFLALAFALAAGRAPAQEAGGAPKPRWGTLRGRILFHGEIPVPSVIADPSRTWSSVDRAGRPIPGAPPQRLKDHEYLGKTRGEITSERLLVDRDGLGVRNAVVCLVEPSAVKASAREAATRPVEFRADRGVFVPHVLAFQRGTHVVVSTDDPITTNAHATFPGATVFLNHSGPDGKPVREAQAAGIFNFVLSTKDRPKSWGPVGVEVVPDGPVSVDAGPVKVVSDIHNWMSAWWLVVDHPYFAVTDDQGRFSIRDAPTGRQRVVVWHEAAGMRRGRLQPVTRGEVEILADGPTEKDFVVERGDLVNIDPPGR